MTLLTSPNDTEMLQELLRTARTTAVALIELQVRQRIRELREEQQQKLLELVNNGHRRPEESPTNKIFEARIGELEDVVANIDFYKESLFVDVDPEDEPSFFETQDESEYSSLR